MQEYFLPYLKFDPSPRPYLDPIHVYRSIQKYGWQGWQGANEDHPIIIRNMYWVQSGQLRIMALMMLGYITIEAPIHMDLERLPGDRSNLYYARRGMHKYMKF